MATALADLLIGGSALLLYFESKTRCWNSTHVSEFAVVYVCVCVLLCKSNVFLSIVAMIVRTKQDDNSFKALAT